jgi:hypothetical protein
MFLEKDPAIAGFRGLHAVQVRLFFSFRHNQQIFPCALVQWFTPVGDEPCADTGMWIVEPDFDHHGQRVTSIIHIDTIVRGAHLLPVFGSALIPNNLHFSETIHAFRAYYINKYADHHMHETAF